ncbi:MAG: HNH endonuclease [Bacteroidota bacterium]|nr:HNH endonuclease [Bacteroidota bacterium]
MITNLQNEKWKQVQFEHAEKLQKKYAVSNMGRVASYTESLKKDGTLLKGSMQSGYNIIHLHVKEKNIAFLVHRAIAELFIKKTGSGRDFVIHLNHKKKDNRVENLKWATQEEVAAHNANNPLVKAARKKQKERPIELKRGMKLTLAQVKQIKQTLANPKRKLTYKQIAAKYKVSEMAITRINSGENWSHVKI